MLIVIELFVHQVTDLIEWAAGDSSLLTQDMPASVIDNLVTLSSITFNMYFDLVCQVECCC